ncbi:MAG: FemAB family PEP-CTERM system-associated protein [Planctomycetes bacterium]|nr:FemAB family PEP-CTERM system-associated protein [Planctomycetota bacterium]MCB9918087.1 FemAB family PEP-CTERM system-associated protein [Planctomycetota bacterium]
MSQVLDVAEAPTQEPKDGPEISILIYVSDPDAQIHVLLRSYSHALAEIGRTGEYVFILDGQSPAMIERLERLQAERDDVRVLTLQGGGHGESIAFRAALEHARGKLILTAWDYLQIDPKSIGPMIEKLEKEELDLISPWRHPRIDAKLNQWQSMLFNWSLRLLSKVGLHDLNCCFRLMRREVLEEVALYGDLFRFLPIMAARRGFQVREVQVVHREERGKTGFFGVGVYFRRLLDILAVTFLTRFTRKPLRFFGIIGMILVTIGLAVALPPVISRIFVQSSIQDRPIVLLGVVLISFGLQFIGFGLVGEIIIFTQSRDLKDYKIDRILTSGPPGAAVIATDAATNPSTEMPVRDASGGTSADRSHVGSAPHRVEVLPAISGQAASGELRLRRPSPGEDAMIDDFLRGCERGTVYHTSAWRRMVESELKTDADSLIVERDDRIVGYLPWFPIKSMFLGKVSISMPFAVYGGIVAEGADVARRLLDVAIERTQERGHAYLELRHYAPYDCAELGIELEPNDRYVTFVRDLPDDPEACLGAIPRKARAEVRKAIQAGVALVPSEDLGRFHRLFTENKQGLGSPTVPRSMLERLRTNFGKDFVLHEVRTGSGRAVAAVLSLRFRDQILPYYSGVLEDPGVPGVNNFMYWSLMAWAVENGIRSFDFGRSRKDSGPASFKKNMGFEQIQLGYQYWLSPTGKLPDFTPDNPKLSGYRRVWQKLPRPVVRGLGGRLFRQLP